MFAPAAINLANIAESTLTHELEDEMDKIAEEELEINQKIIEAKSKVKDSNNE